LDLVRVFKICLIVVSLIAILSPDVRAQDKAGKVNIAFIDSILSKYHLEGVTIFVKKLGVISLSQKRVSLKRKMIDDKLLISLQKNLSFDESGFGARFDYKLNSNWMLRGESYQKNWGRQNGIGLLYRLEY